MKKRIVYVFVCALSLILLENQSVYASPAKTTQVIKPILGDKFGVVMKIQGEVEVLTQHGKAGTITLFKLKVKSIDDRLVKGVSITITSNLGIAKNAISKLKNKNNVILLGYETIVAGGGPHDPKRYVGTSYQRVGYRIKNQLSVIKFLKG